MPAIYRLCSKATRMLSPKMLLPSRHTHCLSVAAPAMHQQPLGPVARRQQQQQQQQLVACQAALQAPAGAAVLPAIWQQQQHRWHCSRAGGQQSRATCCQAASQPPGGSVEPPASSSSSTMLTIPTMLTLARVAAIPALIAAWFWQDPAAGTVVTALFIVASLTDWLDGYLARKLNASSAFGAFLDPVADKLMVATVLVLLSTQPLAAGPFAGNSWIMPVATLVIIGREITMSALREWAASMGPAAKAAVAVNSWGKWKTATQMAALTCLLITRDGASGQVALAAAAAGPPLLAVAAYLTAHSLGVYLAGLWKFMK